MYDNYGNTYTTSEYLVTSSGDNRTNESTAYLAKTGINPTFLDLPSSTKTSNESSHKLCSTHQLLSQIL